jgi:hypothetical protein
MTKKKLLFLALTLAATALLGLFDHRPAEAACPRWCCGDGFCIICCKPPCFCP